MNLSEIVDLVRGELGSRMQLSDAQALSYVGIAQRAAFDSDIDAFLYWDYELTLQTDPVGGEPLTGPYPWPSSAAHPECRRLLGVTVLPDSALLANSPVPFGGAPSDSEIDYGLVMRPGGERNRFVRIRNSPVLREFHFLSTPSSDADYRVVYYIRPRALRNINDDSRVLVPEEWQHHVLVLGATLLADAAIHGDKSGAYRLRDFLFPFHEAMRTQSDDGNAYGNISVGQP